MILYESRTPILQVCDTEFCTKTKGLIDSMNVGESLNAEFVKNTYQDQKNGFKKESRTHWRASNPLLCPVCH
jgi:hypothetical protein